MRVAAMDRRRFLMGSTVAGVGALGLAGCASVPGAPWTGGATLDAEDEELLERTFRWFVDVTTMRQSVRTQRVIFPPPG